MVEEGHSLYVLQLDASFFRQRAHKGADTMTSEDYKELDEQVLLPQDVVAELAKEANILTAGTKGHLKQIQPAICSSTRQGHLLLIPLRIILCFSSHVFFCLIFADSPVVVTLAPISVSVECHVRNFTADKSGMTSTSGNQFKGVFAAVCKHEVVLVAFLMREHECHLHSVMALLALRRLIPSSITPLARVVAYDIGCRVKKFLQATLPRECGDSKFSVGNW